MCGIVQIARACSKSRRWRMLVSLQQCKYIAIFNDALLKIFTCREQHADADCIPYERSLFRRILILQTGAQEKSVQSNMTELQREALREDAKAREIAEKQPDKWETYIETQETEERQDGAESTTMPPSWVESQTDSRLSHKEDDSVVSAGDGPGE